MSKEHPEAEVGLDDLTKALDNLVKSVKTDDPNARKNELLKKSLEGELEDEEKDELATLIKGGSTDEEPDFNEEVLAGLDPEANEDLAKSIEISDYLRAHHGGTVEALDRLADEIQKSGNASLGFNMVLAKAVAEIGHSVQAMNKSLEQVLGQPVSNGRAARTPQQARQPAQPIEKSFAQPDGGGGPQISKEQVLNALEEMNLASDDGLSKSGVDLTQAIAKYEQTGRMQKSLKGDLITYLRSRAGGQG